MSAHTPGPWWVNGDMPGEPKTCFPSVKAFIDGTKAIAVCKVGNNNQYRSARSSSDWDNARLIAAAPELLEALQTVVDDWSAQFERNGHAAPSWCRKARAAIAKATGEPS